MKGSGPTHAKKAPKKAPKEAAKEAPKEAVALSVGGSGSLQGDVFEMAILVILFVSGPSRVLSRPFLFLLFLVFLHLNTLLCYLHVFYLF